MASPRPDDQGVVPPTPRRWNPLADERVRFLFGGAVNAVVGVLSDITPTAVTRRVAGLLTRYRDG